MNDMLHATDLLYAHAARERARENEILLQQAARIIGRDHIRPSGLAVVTDRLRALVRLATVRPAQ